MIKDLADGSRAVGLGNRGEFTHPVTVRWSDLGLKGRQPVRDLWRQKNLGLVRRPLRDRGRPTRGGTGQGRTLSSSRARDAGGPARARWEELPEFASSRWALTRDKERPLARAFVGCFRLRRVHPSSVRRSSGRGDRTSSPSPVSRSRAWPADAPERSGCGRCATLGARLMAFPLVDRMLFIREMPDGPWLPGARSDRDRRWGLGRVLYWVRPEGIASTGAGWEADRVGMGVERGAGGGLAGIRGPGRG